jgi:hypothetical protein
VLARGGKKYLVGTVELKGAIDFHLAERGTHRNQLLSRYPSDPWRGRGEAISLTAIPRRPGTKVGKMSGIRLRNITARAENSVRVCGTPESVIQDVTLENVALTLERWTR